MRLVAGKIQDADPFQSKKKPTVIWCPSKTFFCGQRRQFSSKVTHSGPNGQSRLILGGPQEFFFSLGKPTLITQSVFFRNFSDFFFGCNGFTTWIFSAARIIGTNCVKSAHFCAPQGSLEPKRKPENCTQMCVCFRITGARSYFVLGMIHVCRKIAADGDNCR